MAVFEIGAVFLTEEEHLRKQPEEKFLVSALWTGNQQADHWSGKSRKVDFFDLKGVLEGLFAHLALPHVAFRAHAVEGLHPGRAAEQLYIGEQRIGGIGQLHPDLERRYDLDDTYIFEVENSMR